MASTSETGHAKNVANFEELVTLCKGYGPTYNPANPNLVTTALDTLLSNAKSSLSALNATLPQWINAVNQRENLFKPLSELTTRIISALAASGASKQIVNDAKAIARKLKGMRASSKSNTTADTENTETAPKTISASQMSYDSRVENFDKLVKLLELQPEYAPNESDLAIAGLNTLLTQMRDANTNTINTYSSVSSARLNRNNILYNEDTGLVQIAANVKLYVKSIFGATSPEYKQVARIKFRKDNSV